MNAGEKEHGKNAKRRHDTDKTTTILWHFDRGFTLNLAHPVIVFLFSWLQEHGGE